MSFCLPVCVCVCLPAPLVWRFRVVGATNPPTTRSKHIDKKGGTQVSLLEYAWGDVHVHFSCTRETGKYRTCVRFCGGGGRGCIYIQGITNYYFLLILRTSYSFIHLFIFEQVATKVDDAMEGTVYVLKKHFS